MRKQNVHTAHDSGRAGLTPGMPAGKFIAVFAAFLLVVLLASCSAVNVMPPEVNLIRIDVRDVTLSHVNLLADIRIYNPNDNSVVIQGVDYTLSLEGIKVFSGGNYQATTIKPQEYGFITLRIASAYWDIIQLLNRLPDKTDVAFTMQGSVLVGGSHMFSKRFSFEKKGVIPLQQTVR